VHAVVLPRVTATGATRDADALAVCVVYPTPRKKDPKLLIEALQGSGGKAGPSPLSKPEAAFHVWNYVVPGVGRAR
jgi:hypothetical protein